MTCHVLIVVPIGHGHQPVEHALEVLVADAATGRDAGKLG